ITIPLPLSGLEIYRLSFFPSVLNIVALCLSLLLSLISLRLGMDDIFLSYYESEWVQNCPVKPLFYRRYVDDTLWLLPVDSDVSVLMNYMNTRHSNMRFTYESESNDCIHFIGLTITHLTENNRHKYLTSVYRKPTSTSLFMN